MAALNPAADVGDRLLLRRKLSGGLVDGCGGGAVFVAALNATADNCTFVGNLLAAQVRYFLWFVVCLLQYSHVLTRL